MDYSLIVGIHDRDQEDEVGISFAMPSGADEEEPEDDDAEGGASSAGAGDQVVVLSPSCSNPCLVYFLKT